jgi:hypothetical protein
VAERRASGRPILDLTGSNPTRAGLDYPGDLLAGLGDPGALAYEPEPRGQPRTREAVARDYEGRGVAVSPEHVVLTASTSEAYAWLLKLLCDPGDRILVPRPSYPLFDYLAELEEVEVASYPLLFDGLWHVDPEAVAAAITPRTRAVFVVSPNNPTGSWLSRAAADGLRALCAERALAIVSDEVFADFPLRPRGDRQPSLADDGPGLSFALGGLSKSCGLPQLKLAWIAVAGPEPLRSEALARLELIADTYLSVGTPVQRAAPALLARKPQLAAPIRARLLPGCHRNGAGQRGVSREPAGGGGRLERGAAGSGAPLRRRAGGGSAGAAGCAAAPGLALRLRLGSAPGGEPALGARRSGAGRRATAGGSVGRAIRRSRSVTE